MAEKISEKLGQLRDFLFEEVKKEAPEADLVPAKSGSYARYMLATATLAYVWESPKRGVLVDVYARNESAAIKRGAEHARGRARKEGLVIVVDNRQTAQRAARAIRDVVADVSKARDEDAKVRKEERVAAKAAKAETPAAEKPAKTKAERQKRDETDSSIDADLARGTKRVRGNGKKTEAEEPEAVATS